MLRGNSIVYDNGKEFGNNRDFPKDGRGDALGGVYGNAITTLVDLRNRYGRWGTTSSVGWRRRTSRSKREKSAIVMMEQSDRPGFDKPDTAHELCGRKRHLIELTGNAGGNEHGHVRGHSETGGGERRRDDQRAVPAEQRVQRDGGRVALHGERVPGVRAASPQGSLSLSNVSSVMAGHTPDAATSSNLAIRQRHDAGWRT